MKVIINTVHGGFGLSDNAIRRLFELKGWKCVEKKLKYNVILFYKEHISNDSLFLEQDLERDDPDLVKVVEEMGKEADGRYAQLKIIDVPNDVKWHISEYDGLERVAEDHRTWY